MMDSSNNSVAVNQHRPSRLKLLFTAFSWLLFLVVAIYLIQRAKTLLGDHRIDWSQMQIHWILISVGIYGISLFPQAWYFHRLIQSAHYTPGAFMSFKSHITGHLGKYVPGKTMVVLMRSAMMKKAGVPFLTTVWAAMLETLIFMAVGALLGIISFPFLLNDVEPASLEKLFGSQLTLVLVSLLPYRLLTGIGFILLAIFLVPVLTPILDRLAGKMSQKKTINLQDEGVVSSTEPTINPKHIKQVDVWRGIGWETLSWFFQCLSLVLVMLAWGVIANSIWDFAVWGSLVVVTTVVGFLAFFTPGGLGVKDALLIELLLLTCPVNNRQAVAIAISHRLITLTGEVAVTAILWIISYFTTRKSA